MRYPVQSQFVPPIPETNEHSTTKMIVIIVVVVVGSFLFLGTLAIALGLGLGFGLKDPPSTAAPKILSALLSCDRSTGQRECSSSIPTTLPSMTKMPVTTTLLPNATKITTTLLPNATKITTTLSTYATTYATKTTSITTAILSTIVTSPSSSSTTTTTTTTTTKTTTTMTTTTTTETIITTASKPTTWPFIVAVYLRNQKLCTGFLLTNRHVITSATCVYNLHESSLSIHFGSDSLSKGSDVLKRSILSVAYPRTYRKGRTVDDIAVLTLASNVTLSLSVSLCPIAKNLSIPQMNDNSVVVGWNNDIAVSEKIQKAEVKVENLSTCELPTTTEGQFCGRYTAMDICDTDRGSPLLLQETKDKWTCAGIAIGNRSKCRSAGIYTRISYYDTFITNSIER
ncbi:unnamed protein product [Adineta ricciae]|uniref:Peptidase S1 domain-containing protein n=1 Tax=Adineta ricciae TaxID=249248 RepID=A0A813N615_ADIRI|nr:unnamed protein product [Adineta ricciae]CAF1233134.1 unnamed protein product [Adineta ricciae]